TQKAEFEKCVALNRQFWDRHRGFFRELTQASKVLFCPRPKRSWRPRVSRARRGRGPAASYYGEQWILDCFNSLSPGFFGVSTQQSVHYLLLGVIYLLTVNAGVKPRQATFRLPAGN